MFDAMDEPKELPGKKAPKIEDPKTKKSTPSAPVETPVPPQVMDPSAPRDEKSEPSTSPHERKRKPSKTKRTS